VTGKAILGVAMLELGHAEDAEACLAEAVSASPAHPAFCEALARAQAAGNALKRAQATLAAGIAALPDAASLRNAAIMLAIRQGDFALAVDLAEAGRRDGVADACLFGLKAHALSTLGRHEEAALAYEEALKLGPEDPYVRHLVSAAGALPSARRAPPEYLRAVFDGYAARFEAHLIGLGYRVPGLIRAAVRRHAALPEVGRLGPVLDLGCGTGLVAVALSDLPLGPLTGVDLSQRMLDEAATKQLYEELHQEDATAFLAASPPERWAMVLAGDVLCYFGALDSVMAAVHAALRPGGLFILSVEAIAEGSVAAEGWLLGKQGRYAHSPAYLAQVARAAGFVVRATEPQSLRLEAESPVPGLIAVLERPGNDG
jgi:predicted TPR repeat methyltransferase